LPAAVVLGLWRARWSLWRPSGKEDEYLLEERNRGWLWLLEVVSPIPKGVPGGNLEVFDRKGCLRAYTKRKQRVLSRPSE
jgi:hypothetical protein